MSKKIDDVLEVLMHMRHSYQPGHPDSIREARKSAIKTIGAGRGVTHQTIADAYLRRPKPQVDGTPQFDLLVGEWLDGRSDTLRRALEHHARDSGDQPSISKFFS
jgi:hypothetical protein